MPEVLGTASRGLGLGALRLGEVTSCRSGAPRVLGMASGLVSATVREAGHR